MDFFHLGTERFKSFLEEHQSGAAYPAISDGKIKNFKIPIPPLKTQAKIVDILDRFEMLANSLAKGLPREIELKKTIRILSRATFKFFASLKRQKPPFPADKMKKTAKKFDFVRRKKGFVCFCLAKLRRTKSFF